MIGFINNPYQSMYSGYTNTGLGSSMNLSFNVSLGSSGLSSMTGSTSMSNPMFSMFNSQSSSMYMMQMMMQMMSLMSSMSSSSSSSSLGSLYGNNMSSLYGNNSLSSLYGNSGLSGLYGNSGLSGLYGNSGLSGMYSNGLSSMFDTGYMSGAKGQIPMGSSGQLSQESEGKPITYKTTGGYTINVDKTTITITDPNGQNTVETWGDPHQKLNGENVGDWTGKDRTIVLGDGTKVSMHASGAQGTVENMEIIDGKTGIQINNSNNSVTNVTNNPYQTKSLDNSVSDGETAYFGNTLNGSSVFKDVYNQDSNFNVTSLSKLFGSSTGYNSKMTAAS
ncbi:MAG: DUF1521 domain-containing protein [Firmicutes bacterium]|nr:DUF1521 domain-containing protein [Bacillota bacterium]